MTYSSGAEDSAQSSPPRLIVSDIDGTFLNSADRVPQAVRRSVHAALEQGVHFALATGRPFRWLAPVVEQIAARPVCVTSNGAVLYDVAADEVLEAAEMPPELMAEVYEIASEALAEHGGVSIAAERVGHSVRQDDREIFVVSEDFVHGWVPESFSSVPTRQVWQAPAVKLLLRNPDLSAQEMYDLIAPHVDSARAHLTFSMDVGLIEVAAPGINKAHGVAGLAQRYGVEPDNVLAFGDMPNDIEMLRWAGMGVAMGNAHRAVKQEADIVTATNDEAGIAEVIDGWL